MKRRTDNPESHSLAAKKVRGESRTVKGKFQDEKESKVVPLVALTINQGKYIEALKTKQLVYAVGSSGSGKTFVACLHAVNKFLRGECEKIVLIRPYEFVGRSVGLRPGTNIEKLLPIAQSMVEPIKEALGMGQFEYALEHEQIILESLEDCRGRSYKNSVIVVDECSNTDTKAMQTLVTRIGEGSQMICCGDSASWQQDIKGESGLAYITKLLKKLKTDKPTYLNEADFDNLYNNIAIVNFTTEDVVRSGIASLFVKAFDKEQI